MSDGVARIEPIALDGAGSSAPEWVHLLPSGTVSTHDGRGPYVVRNPHAIVAASFPNGTGKLVLCENHATDIAAPKGGASPARGWITAMDIRSDGIWGRIGWTAEGRRLVSDREYRGISPVIAHRGDGTVVAIRRATLTNTPNLAGLTTLHSKDADMELRLRLIKALGLPAGSSEDAILHTIRTLKRDVAGGAEGESMREAERIATQATAYQQELSDRGITLDFASAVVAVQNGVTIKW